MKSKGKENTGMYKSLGEYKSRENKFGLVAGEGEEPRDYVYKGAGRVMAVLDLVALGLRKTTVGQAGEQR